MAGLQSCLKNIFTSNSLRIVHKNYSFHQTVRKKHLLTIAVTTLKKPHHFKNPRTVLNLNFKNAYRCCSTDFKGSTISDNQSDVMHSSSNHQLDSGSSISVPNSPLNETETVTEGSTVSSSNSGIIIDESLLPAPPSIPVETVDVSTAAEVLVSALKEPSFASLGLNSYWPTGWIQRALEYLHITWDLPWWAAIAIVTVVLRSATLPLNIKARKNSINMNNNLPQIQVLQMKITEARQMGNYYDSARYLQELQLFLKEKNIVTIGAVLPALAQAPIFLSMFWGLRSMTNLPVESMKTGGFLWFTDLTIADPYYLLPLGISGTMTLIIESGAEGSSVSSLTNVWMKYGLRALPLVLFPFTIFFPAALQVYWVTSNSVALIQVLMLKIPFLRNYFNIPIAIKHDPLTLPNAAKKKGLDQFKESYTNLKLMNEVADRERLNTVTFEKAGSGPIPRTFKRDPTKIQNAVQK